MAWIWCPRSLHRNGHKFAQACSRDFMRGLNVLRHFSTQIHFARACLCEIVHGLNLLRHFFVRVCDGFYVAYASLCMDLTCLDVSLTNLTCLIISLHKFTLLCLDISLCKLGLLK